MIISELQVASLNKKIEALKSENERLHKYIEESEKENKKLIEELKQTKNSLNVYDEYIADLLSSLKEAREIRDGYQKALDDLNVIRKSYTTMIRQLKGLI